MNRQLGATFLILMVTGCASYQRPHDDTAGLQLAGQACQDEPMSLGTTMFPAQDASSVRMATLATPSDFTMRSASTPATSPLLFRHRTSHMACLD